MGRVELLRELEDCFNTVADDVARRYDCLRPNVVMEPRKGCTVVAGLPSMGRLSSSGRTYFYDDGTCDIVIMFGNDPLDVVLVFLHEMSHCIVRPHKDRLGRWLSHTRSFYQTAASLYHDYKIPLVHVLSREGRYKKSSIPIILHEYSSE